MVNFEKFDDRACVFIVAGWELPLTSWLAGKEALEMLARVTIMGIYKNPRNVLHVLKMGGEVLEGGHSLCQVLEIWPAWSSSLSLFFTSSKYLAVAGGYKWRKDMRSRLHVGDLVIKDQCHDDITVEKKEEFGELNRPQRPTFLWDLRVCYFAKKKGYCAPRC